MLRARVGLFVQVAWHFISDFIMKAERSYVASFVSTQPFRHAVLCKFVIQNFWESNRLCERRHVTSGRHKTKSASEE